MKSSKRKAEKDSPKSSVSSTESLLRKCRSRECKDRKPADLCKHKEARFGLPSMHDGQHGRWQKPVDPQHLDRQADDLSEAQTLENYRVLANRLIDFGLEEWEISVLMAHDVSNLSFEEIREEGGFTSLRVVMGIYRRAADKAARAYARENGDG